jgi:hypothetical protein
MQLAPPQRTVLDDRLVGEQRALRLHVRSPRGAPNMYLDIQASGQIEAALDRKPLDLHAIPADQRARLRLTYHAIPAEGFELDLTVADGGLVNVRLEDCSNGLPSIPGLTVSPRPAQTMGSSVRDGGPDDCHVVSGPGVM